LSGFFSKYALVAPAILSLADKSLLSKWNNCSLSLLIVDFTVEI
jgi:hypothetical protein